MNLAEIIGELKKKRPTIRDTSAKQYRSVLRGLHQQMKGNKDISGLDFLKDTESVMELIGKKELTTAKNYLTGIVVMLKIFPQKYENEIEKYSDELYARTKQYKDFIDTQKKTKKQEANWASWKDIINILNRLNSEIKLKKLRTKENLTKKERSLVQLHLILSLYTLNAPVRSSPYADTKIITQKAYKKLSKEEEADHNWLVVGSRQKKLFIINKYKTSRTYGRRVIEVSRRLSRILTAWLKINKGEWLLTKQNGEKMTSNNVTKALNTIFDRYGKGKISTSMLRHIYITKELTEKPMAREEKKELATQMGHSTATQEDYAKFK